MTEDEFNAEYSTDHATSTQLWAAVNLLVEQCHQDNAHWWVDPKTGTDLRNNPLVFPARIAQVITELSEAIEGHRKSLMDDHVTFLQSAEVECADALIRLCDLCGALGLDMARAVVAKRLFNKQRADHKAENRMNEGGKAY